MDVSNFAALPDELLEVIVLYLPPKDTLAFGSTCKRGNKIIYEPLVWRRYCVQGWRYWEPRHEIKENILLPPAQIKWRRLFEERTQTDRKASELFDEMLSTQQFRIERIESIAESGYDIKDLMLKLRDQTPDDADDVLARRYYANTILGRVHRATALEKWSRLQNSQMVRLEEVLGAYDLFVLGDTKGDLNDLDQELDRIANAVQATDPEFDYLTTRQKALAIARYLRDNNLVGNPSVEDYHALRNNFISMALFESPHTSMPLITVAIYCAVARRLGVNARPANYPRHVYAVVQAPPHVTLDGARRSLLSSPPEDDRDMDQSRTMHMDPWRSSDEAPRAQLSLTLSNMGAPLAQHDSYLCATSNLEMALRTGRNIMNSVQEARDRQRGAPRQPAHPDVEAAWYSMLWAMMVLGETSRAARLYRRRQCLPYLVEHYSAHFPEDLGLLERIVTSMFEGEREHANLIQLITTGRNADQNRKAPSFRNTSNVQFRIGTLFQHKRYGYQGIIVGWDLKCCAEERWIVQMRVDELPRGQDQPFYNVMYVSSLACDTPTPVENVFTYQCMSFPGLLTEMFHDSADDKSPRYVAEENIGIPAAQEPNETLMSLAGRYFKRWDKQERKFVSNIRDEYPED